MEDRGNGKITTLRDTIGYEDGRWMELAKYRV
jgi:hypothetical protein